MYRDSVQYRVHQNCHYCGIVDHREVLIDVCKELFDSARVLGARERLAEAERRAQIVAARLRLRELVDRRPTRANILRARRAAGARERVGRDFHEVVARHPVAEVVHRRRCRDRSTYSTVYMYNVQSRNLTLGICNKEIC